MVDGYNWNDGDDYQGVSYGTFSSSVTETHQPGSAQRLFRRFDPLMNSLNHNGANLSVAHLTTLSL